MQIYTIVQILTMAALIGLLFACGLRLSPAQVLTALGDRPRFLRTLIANFAGVPALALGLIAAAGLPNDVAVGVLLLAAAPFAPVVPVFTRLARGDLALAAALTAIFPLLSSVLTPWAGAIALKCLSGSIALQFDVRTSLMVLLTTITVPLLAGVSVNHYWPQLCRLLVRPVEVGSEAIGAVSLAFVATVEWRSIVTTGWPSLLTMVILFELSLLLGYAAGGPSAATRRVIALGTSNRNIALAILIAVRSFPGTPVVAAVVGNGLLMIGLGLLHTAWWRWRPSTHP